MMSSAGCFVTEMVRRLGKVTLHYLCTNQLSEASYKKKMNAYRWHTSRDADCNMNESFSADKRDLHCSVACVQNITCILPLISYVSLF